MSWTTKKPTLDHPCILLACNNSKDHNPEVYEIVKVDNPENDDEYYWNITQNGYEWGAYEDLQADYYRIIEYPKEI